MWRKEGEKTLHRHDSPAMIEVNLNTRFYRELWVKDGMLQSQNDHPAFTELDGHDFWMQWYQDDGLHRSNGPATLEYNAASHSLVLKWYLDDVAAYIHDQPTHAQFDTQTGVTYLEEYSSGTGREAMRTHRHDHIFIITRDRKTGVVTRSVYHFHGDNPHKDGHDMTLICNPETGTLEEIEWGLNEQKTGTTMPEGFSWPRENNLYPGLKHNK